MKRIKRSILILCLLMGTFSTGFGEDFFRVKQRIMDNAWRKISIFYVTPSIEFSNLGYHSNIYSYDYLESPDWTARMNLNLNLAVIMKDRFILTVEESPSYNFYKDNDDENAFNNVLKLTGYTWLGKFNIKYQYERPYMHAIMNPELDWRLRRSEHHHTLSVDYGQHRRFYFNIYLKRSTFDFEDEQVLGSFNLNELFNRTEYWTGLSINKAVFSRSRLSFQLEYFDHQYQFTPERDRDGGQFSVSLVLPTAGGVTGVIRYGMRFVRPDTTLYRGFSKPFGSGAIAVRFMRRFRVHLDYLLENRYSFSGANIYYDEQSVGTGLTCDVTRPFRVRYSFRTGRRSYRSLSAGDEQRRDYFYLHRFTATLRVADKTEIGLEFRTYYSDSTQLRYYRGYNFIGGYIRYDF